MPRFFIFIWIIIIIINCNGTSNESPSIDPACKKFNKEASTQLYNFSLYGDSAYIDSALFLIEKAIACDSNYYNAYSNCLVIASYKQDKNLAFKSVNALLRLSQNDINTIYMKAALFDKYGLCDSAAAYYFTTKKEASRLLTNHPDSITGIQLYVMSTEALNGSYKAKKAYDSLTYRLNDQTVYARLEQMKDLLIYTRAIGGAQTSLKCDSLLERFLK